MLIRKTNHQLKSISSSIHEGAEETSVASSQVASASQSLAQGASEQAASIEEASASMEEINSMCQQNAEHASRASALSSATKNSAESGAHEVIEMTESMTAIQNACNDISKIVKSINEIAFQTNILALNASVEAARAGEAGAGFAVVADEVRNLAQRAAIAADETAMKVEDSIRKSQIGGTISQKVAERFNEILHQTSQLDQLVAGINSASNEQTQGIEQVKVGITQMEKVTQSSAAMAEECAASATQLKSQADHLLSNVELLNEIVVGSSTPSTNSFESQFSPRSSFVTSPTLTPPPSTPLTVPKRLSTKPLNHTPSPSSRTIPLEEFKDFS